MRVEEEAPLSAQQSLDAKIAKSRAEHSCLKRLDKLMFCMSELADPFTASCHTHARPHRTLTVHQV